ncbi:MAG: Gfo/Idh/MocA family oxidoreductase [Actinobacteria bacterium]|nr:Gfo/Idh/MocA family oxidoreductase [Actinomycetota bacterium]
MRFGVGVIGATGYIGTPYRREIRGTPEDARIVALCARRREPLEAAAREDGEPFITDDWRKVVEHPDVNVVLVATPDRLHVEPVLAAAKAGKHIVCEKPIAADAPEARRMWEAARDARVATFVPFWTRYSAGYVKARELVRAGAVGEVRAIIYRWHNPRPAAMPFTWRDDATLSSAGSIADVGSHSYESVRYITGLAATRALAHGTVITPPKPDLGTPNLIEALAWGQAHVQSGAGGVALRRGTAFDYAAIACEYDNGAVGVYVVSHASCLRKGLAPELELHGTEASLSIDRASGVILLAKPDQAPVQVATAKDSGATNRFKEYVFPALRAQLAGQVVEAPTLEEGYRVQLFADAAARSARQGGWIDARG